MGWAFSSTAFALANNDACHNLPAYQRPTQEGQDPTSNCARAANEAEKAAKSDLGRGDNFAASTQAPAATAGVGESQRAGSEGLVQQGQDLEQKKTNAVTAYTSCQTNAGIAAERWGALKNAAQAANNEDAKDFSKFESEAKTLAGSCKSKAASTQSFSGGRDMQKLGEGRDVGDEGKAKDPKSKEPDDKVGSSGGGGMSGAMMPALLGAVGGGIAGYMFGKSKATTETATTTKTETASNTNTATDTSDKIDCTKLGLATNTDGTCMAAAVTSGTSTSSGNVVVNGVAQDTTGNNSNTTNSPSQTLPASSSGGPNVGGAVSQTGSSGTNSSTATNSGTYVQNSLSGKSTNGIAALNATSARSQSATATDTATGSTSALAAPSGGGGASWRRNLSDEEEAAKAGANPLNYNYIDGGRNGRSLAGGNVQSTLNRIENPDCNSSDDAARVACQNERKAQDRAQLAVYCSRYPGASKCRNLDK